MFNDKSSPAETNSLFCGGRDNSVKKWQSPNKRLSPERCLAVWHWSHVAPSLKTADLTVSVPSSTYFHDARAKHPRSCRTQAQTRRKNLSIASGGDRGLWNAKTAGEVKKLTSKGTQFMCNWCVSQTVFLIDNDWWGSSIPTSWYPVLHL